MDEHAVLLYLRYNPRCLIHRAERLPRGDLYDLRAAGWRVKTFDAGDRLCRVAIAQNGQAFASAAVLDGMERLGLIEPGRYWQTYQLTDAGRRAADKIMGHDIND